MKPATFLFIVLTASLLFQAKCKSDEASFPIGTPFTLAAGAIKVNEANKLVVTFDSVPEDSRCPKYTNCVWEGQARVLLTFGLEEIELTLHEGEAAKASRSMGAYTITLKAVTPYPESGKKIEEEDYVLELLVTENQP